MEQNTNLNLSSTSNSQTVPTYQNLFGSDSYYTVPQHRSVLSPAAYFVELMKLVDKNINVGSDGISLQTRRPDLWDIRLDERNTDHEISKLSIVNERLQKYSESLQKHLKVKALPLPKATYPFNLPYNPHLQEIRQYLAQHKTTPQDIWKKLIPEPQRTSDQSKSIHLETLGLSHEQWKQYTTSQNTSSALYQYYGFASDTDLKTAFNLSSSSDDTGYCKTTTFLEYTGLTQSLLRELVYGDLSEEEIHAAENNQRNHFYINQIQNGDTERKPIAINGEQLEHLSIKNLDRIMRFVRLAQAIGWSFTDLDWAIQTIRPLVNSKDQALPYLAWMQEQVKENGLSVNQACACLGTVKDFGEKIEASFFDQVFKDSFDRIFPAPIHKPKHPEHPKPTEPTEHTKFFKYQLIWTVPKPSTTPDKTSRQIESALTAALQVSQDDLLSIANIISTVDTTPKLKLTASNLAILYRLSLLPKLTGLSIKDALLSANLSCVNRSDLASTDGANAMNALTQLAEFSSWLKKSPFSLYQLQFILTGKSYDSAIQNKILGANVVTNFLQDFNTSIQQTLLTKSTFLEENALEFNQLIAKIASVESGVSPVTIQQLSDKIYKLLLIKHGFIVGGIVINPESFKSFIAKTPPSITDYVKPITHTAKIEPVFTDLLDATYRTLLKYYQLQQKTFIDRLAALYSVTHQIGAVLNGWGELNISSLLDAGSMPAPGITNSLLANFVISSASKNPQSSPATNVQTATSTQLLLLQKIQQAAELITGLSLSPAEAEYFQNNFQPTAAYPITLATVQTECQFKELVKSFQDSQNNLLNILENTLQVQCMATFGNTLFAGTSIGLYTVNGQIFEPVTTNIPFSSDEKILFLTTLSANLVSFAGTSSGIYEYNDPTQSWLNEPFTFNGIPATTTIQCFAELGPSSGEKLYAGTSSGLWEVEISNPPVITFNLAPSAKKKGIPQNANVQCLAYHQETFYAGTSCGLYYCDSSSAGWKLLTTGQIPASANIQCLATLGTALYAGTSSGLYYSPTWTQIAEPLFPYDVNVQCMLPGITPYIGTTNGLYSWSQESNWTLVTNGISATANVLCLTKHGASVYAGTSNGIYSLDNDSKWLPIQGSLAANTHQLLAKLAGWNEEQLIFLNKRLYLTFCSIAEIALAQKYFDTAKRLSIDIDSLYRLTQLPTKNSATDESDCANALWGGLQAQYSEQPAVLTKLQNKLNEALRDKLVAQAMHSLNVDSARALYEYFLIDVEVSGSVQTSFIREATGAVQLYIYRCLNHLEPNVTVNPGLARIWTWMYAYREWQANMEVFLYPEDYIQPELRKNKTDLFAKLESDLKQADLTNPDKVESAFREYMNGLAEIGGLTIVGNAVRNYTRDDGNAAKELCLVGRTASQPGKYFYRVASFVNDQPRDWGQWQKINIQIHPVKYQNGNNGPELTGAVSPTFAFGTWYLFWVEQKQTGGTANGTTANPTPHYTITIQYTHLDFSRRWVAAQTLVAIDEPFTPVLTEVKLTPSLTFTLYNHNTTSIQVIYSYCCFNNVLYAATQSGLYSSTDGVNWNQVSIPNFTNVIQSVVAFNNALYAATQSGFYSSADGVNWNPVSNTNFTNGVQSVVAFNNVLYAATGKELYSSADGVNWTRVLISSDIKKKVLWLYAFNNVLYVASTNELNELYSSADGNVWNLIRPISTLKLIYAVSRFNNVLYAATAYGLYSSADGVNWNPVSNTNFTNGVQSVAVFNNALYAATGNGLYSSADGINWNPVSNTIFTNGVQSVAAFNNVLYAATGKELYSSADGINWNPVSNTNFTKDVQSVAAFNNVLYAATGNGLYSSADGINWNPVSNTNFTNGVQSVAAFNNVLYAATGKGLYSSADGVNWNPVSNTNFTNGVQSVAAFNNVLYAATGNGLYSSADGNAWNLITPISDQEPSSFTVSRFNNVLYAAMGNELYSSADGVNWHQVLNSEFNNVSCVYTFNNILYVVNNAQIYLSNYDKNLVVYRDSTQYLLTGNNDACAQNETVISQTVSNDNGVETITLESDNYALITYLLNSSSIGSLSSKLHISDGLNALLATTTQQILDSNDFTMQSAMSVYYWELFFQVPFLIANELQTQQHFKHAKKWYEYIFNPGVNQANWDLQEGEIANDKFWRFLGLRSAINQNLARELSETAKAELWNALQNSAELHKSNTDPFDPQAIAALRPIAYQKTILTHYINNLLAWGDRLFRENTRESIGEAEMFYVMANDLLGEQPQNLGPLQLPATVSFTNLETCWMPAPLNPSITDLDITCISYLGSTLYVGTAANGLYSSTDGGKSWSQATLNPSITDLDITCINYLGSTLYVGTAANGLYSSTDGGNSWSSATLNPSITDLDITLIQSFGGTVYVGTTENGLYSSTGGGNSWLPATLNPPITDLDITCINYLGITLYVGTAANGLYSLTDVGNSWSSATLNPSITDLDITCINYLGSTLYVGTAANGLYSSTEGGNSWSQVTVNSFPTTAHITLIQSFGGTVYVGTTENGLYSSTDGGKSWSQATLNPSITALDITCINYLGSTLYVGTAANGLYSSTDGGNSWSPATANSFPTTANITSIQSFGGTVYVGTAANGLWVLPNYFAIPRNRQFLAYWGKVKRRLYDIRHSLTITGQPDNLPLFQPPINPMQLVEDVASGEGVAQAIESLSNTVPYYRFSVMIEKAMAATQSVISLGQSLLSALEQKDAEQLAMLFNTNQQHILHMSLTSNEDQRKAAENNLLALQAGLSNAQNRLTYYNQLINAGLSAGEVAQIELSADAIAIQAYAEPIKIAGIIGYLVPNIYGLADGGMKFGDAINMGANIVESAGNLFNMGAGIAGTVANYQRRAQDWQLQATLAQDDINQIQFQIVAAQYQKHLAEQGIALLETQIEQQQTVAKFYLNKFTNVQLYHWYIGKVSTLYFQAYQLAHDLALQAQNAWKFEHIGLLDLSASRDFIVPGNWSNLYQGLLAGEALQLDLQRMEKAYIDQNVRRLEISKTISLAMLDPVQLMHLINNGQCHFDISEKDFAWDFPGHFCRKIKSVSISIPMILGPYQNIHATLTQLSSKLVNSDGTDGQNAVQYLLEPYNPVTKKGVNLSSGNTALQTNLIPNQQIALSQGVNDTGMFELNFNDPRYLPFEGTGAVSSWSLDLPKDENSINYESITDVIIQINYTALPASNAYKKAVSDARGTFSGYHAISLAQEFPSAWHGFVQSGGSNSLQFTVNAKNWRGAAAANSLTIMNAWLYAVGTPPSGTTLTWSDTPETKTTITFPGFSENDQPSKGVFTAGSSGFPTSQQTIQLKVTGTLPSGLQNLILIVEYSVQG